MMWMCDERERRRTNIVRTIGCIMHRQKSIVRTALISRVRKKFSIVMQSVVLYASRTAVVFIQYE